MFKNTKKNSFILVLITFVILFFVVKNDFHSILKILINSNFLFVLISLALSIIYYFFKTCSIYEISLKYKSKIKYKTIFKQTIITQFFNGITPFATGGQPMQIYMLTKEKMAVSKATSTVLMDFMAYQIAIILYCIVTLFLDFKLHLFGENVLARNLVLLGFVINLIVCFFASIFCFSRRITSFLIKQLSKILNKIHKQDLIDNISYKINEFHDGTKLFIKDIKLFFKSITLNIIGLTAFYVIPYFLSYAITGGFDITILISVVSSSYIFLVGAFVPIPGGSGGIEYGFVQFFGKYFSNSHLMALLLLWRFTTYYFGIILGGLLFGFNKKEGD